MLEFQTFSDLSCTKVTTISSRNLSCLVHAQKYSFSKTGVERHSKLYPVAFGEYVGRLLIVSFRFEVINYSRLETCPCKLDFVLWPEGCVPSSFRFVRI